MWSVKLDRVERAGTAGSAFVVSVQRDGQPAKLVSKSYSELQDLHKKLSGVLLKDLPDETKLSGVLGSKVLLGEYFAQFASLDGDDPKVNQNLTTFFGSGSAVDKSLLTSTASAVSAVKKQPIVDLNTDRSSNIFSRLETSSKPSSPDPPSPRRISPYKDGRGSSSTSSPYKVGDQYTVDSLFAIRGSSRGSSQGKDPEVSSLESLVRKGTSNSSSPSKDGQSALEALFGKSSSRASSPRASSPRATRDAQESSLESLIREDLAMLRKDPPFGSDYKTDRALPATSAISKDEEQVSLESKIQQDLAALRSDPIPTTAAPSPYKTSDEPSPDAIAKAELAVLLQKATPEDLALLSPRKKDDEQTTLESKLREDLAALRSDPLPATTAAKKDEEQSTLERKLREDLSALREMPSIFGSDSTADKGLSTISPAPGENLNAEQPSTLFPRARQQTEESKVTKVKLQPSRYTSAGGAAGNTAPEDKVKAAIDSGLASLGDGSSKSATSGPLVFAMSGQSSNGTQSPGSELRDTFGEPESRANAASTTSISDVQSRSLPGSGPESKGTPVEGQFQPTRAAVLDELERLKTSVAALSPTKARRQDAENQDSPKLAQQTQAAWETLDHLKNKVSSLGTTGMRKANLGLAYQETFTQDGIDTKARAENLRGVSSQKYEIIGDGEQVLKINLFAGQTIWTEPGCMLNCDNEVRATVDTGYGCCSCFRGMCSAADLFFAVRWTNKASSEKSIYLVPRTGPSKVLPINLAEWGEEALVKSTAFLAATDANIKIARARRKQRRIFEEAGQEVAVKQLKGKSLVFLSAAGLVFEQTLKEGDTIVVDRRRIVAWQSSCKFAYRRAESMRCICFGRKQFKQFIDLTVTGPGRVILQAMPINKPKVA